MNNGVAFSMTIDCCVVNWQQKTLQHVTVGFADRLVVRPYIILMADSQEATFVTA